MNWEKGKTFPVVGTSMTIPWSVAEEAYLGYNPDGRYSQTLLRLAERGGFHVSELDDYVPDWREKTSEITRLRAELETLTAEREKAEQVRHRMRILLLDARDSLEQTYGAIVHELPSVAAPLPHPDAQQPEEEGEHGS